MDIRLYFNPLPLRRGRPSSLMVTYCPFSFQSTPSSQRETDETECLGLVISISIHSLLAEGDFVRFCCAIIIMTISIHSLLAKGDEKVYANLIVKGNFNPLPPRRGRLGQHTSQKNYLIFQSTPSSQRETFFAVGMASSSLNFNPLPPRRGRLHPGVIFFKHLYFNPLPPRRGRRILDAPVKCFTHFNPLPPRRGRQQKRTKIPLAHLHITHKTHNNSSKSFFKINFF